jgi:hypothetical protein
LKSGKEREVPEDIARFLATVQSGFLTDGAFGALLKFSGKEDARIDAAVKNLLLEPRECLQLLLHPVC